ncbi:MAG: hypothetical protein ACFB21_02025 [Opitutales bacterium]
MNSGPQAALVPWFIWIFLIGGVVLLTAVLGRGLGEADAAPFGVLGAIAAAPALVSLLIRFVVIPARMQGLAGVDLPAEARALQPISRVLPLFLVGAALADTNCILALFLIEPSALGWGILAFGFVALLLQAPVWALPPRKEGSLRRWR